MKTIFSILVFALALSANAQIIPDSVDLGALRESDIIRKTPAQIHADNMRNYAAFVAYDVDTDKDWDKPKFLRPSAVREILDEADKNPVVSLYQYEKYDPDNEGIGFCFGRAMFVHLELAQHGLDRDSIKKAFVVGPMKTPDGSTWGWHVTTIAQSLAKNGREAWVAIDPITGPKDVRTWYSEMRDQYSTDKKLKLYITTSGRFGVNSSTYDERVLKHKFYNNYFRDMMKWFDRESRQTDHYKVPYTEYTKRPN